MRVKRMNKNILVEQQAGDRRAKPVSDKFVVNKVNLRNIIEVTEENQPNPLPTLQSAINQQQPSFQQKESCVKRCFRCISNLCKSLFSKSINFQIETKEGNFSQIIEQIKSRKMDYAPLLPPQKGNKRVLVLDLDQTLIHTSFMKPVKYDYQSQVLFNGKNTKIFTVKRFGLESFLFQMSKLYQIVIFTASQKLYADRIIDLIDPKKRISHRLYRHHCFIINKTYFLKSIKALGRNPKDVIIVDDNNIAGLLQPQNFYKIEPFEGSEKDRHLLRLSSFLKYLQTRQKFNSVKEEWKQFQSVEIDVSEQGDCSSIKSSISEGRSLAEKKKYYSHKKRNSQIQNLVTKSTEDQNQAEESAVDFIRKL